MRSLSRAFAAATLCRPAVGHSIAHPSIHRPFPLLRVVVLDLQKYLDQGVRVKLQGGREVRGVLKGFDPLVNVVLDECIEFIRDPADPYKLTEETRELGLVVCRGTQVSLISPTDGMEEIENPFVAQEG